MEDEYEGKGKYYPTAVLTNKKLLLDNSLCELSIKIGNETVLAHAAIVASRCEDIIPFVQDAKSQKKKKHEVKLKDGTVKNAAVMSKILEFIYTGTLEFAKLTNEEILFVNGGARNLNLVRLVYLCEKFLRDNLSMENLFHLLKAATDLNEQRVKAFCLCFALDHYNDFITNKDGIKILGIELFQEVVAAFQGNKPVVEEKPAPQDQYLDDFKRLYEHMPYSDFHFALDGEQIKCHKAILIAHSDQFNNILKVENAIQQDRVSAKAVRSMLKYLYYGDEDIEQSAAVELVPFARRYKLHALLRVCEDKIRINLSTDTILDVLSVAYMPSEKQDLIEEIKSKSFPFIIENLTQINLQTLRMQHPMMAIDLLFRLQDASKKGEIKLSGLVSGYTPPVNEPAGHKHSNNNNNNNNNSSNNNNNNNNSHNISIQNSSSNSNLSSSGGSFPPSPKAPENSLPPPLLSQRPPPPPRNSVSQNSQNFPPPPSLGNPSPNASSGSISARGDPTETTTVDSEVSGKKVKKTLSQKDLKNELKQSSSSKKEEEKKKKEEAKRLAKEKKERQKMEKKFKGH